MNKPEERPASLWKKSSPRHSKPLRTKVGQRVQIVHLETSPRSPEHAGKEGRVVGTREIVESERRRFWTYEILLDDGTELLGIDCWWEKI